jgi:hypothetical protein
MTTEERRYPETVDEAADVLHTNMSLNEEFFMAEMDEQDLTDLHLSLGPDIRADFGLEAGNEALMQSCRQGSGDSELSVHDASLVIMKALWKKVRETHSS